MDPWDHCEYRTAPRVHFLNFENPSPAGSLPDGADVRLRALVFNNFRVIVIYHWYTYRPNQWAGLKIEVITEQLQLRLLSSRVIEFLIVLPTEF